MSHLLWVGAVVGAVVYICWDRLRVGLPPGPKGVPLVGSWSALRGHPRYVVLTRWAKQYGEFYSFRVGSRNTFVVSGAAALDELFNKKGALYNTRPQSSAQAHRVTGDTRGVALPYGEPWRERRRVLQSLLSGQNAKFFLPYQDFESKVVLYNLVDRPETFFYEASRYSSSVTMSMLLGARFENSGAFVPQRVREEMTLFWQYITPGSWLTDWLPFLDGLPSPLAPWRRKADWMHDRWYSFWSLFLDRMVERHRQGVAQDCFLTRFLDEPGAERWSHEDMAGIIAEILSAGTETTIASVQWFFRISIFFPEAMERAKKEIDSVVGRSRLPNWDDRPNLPYVDALIQELHRWASVAPLAVDHATIDSDTYRGFKVPKGASVVANTWGAHHDAQIYPNPELFSPGRFLPAKHPLHDAENANFPKHFAFGVGRRACPGAQVANASLYIVISRLLWGFDIAAAPSGLPRLETLPNPLVIALAPFECTVSPRNEAATELIKKEAQNITPPQNLESASAYDEFVRRWDERNPRL